MYFNAWHFIFRFAFGTVMTAFSMAWMLTALPFKIAGKTASIAGTVLAFTTIKPAAKILKNTLFKEPPPKRYMKIGKPAIAPLIINGGNRPALSLPSNIVAQKTIVHREARADMVQRSTMQQKMFMAKFADVVQV